MLCLLYASTLTSLNLLNYFCPTAPVVVLNRSNNCDLKLVVSKETLSNFKATVSCLKTSQSL